MNKDQVLNYLIRNDADYFDQRIEWSNTNEFTPQQAEFLLHMRFMVFSCDMCGNTYYNGDEELWLYETGIQPRQDHKHVVIINEDNGTYFNQWSLCDHCFKNLINMVR